jgi:uncharacterized protein (TIGR00369 family)
VSDASSFGHDGPGEAIGLAYDDVSEDLVRAHFPVTPAVTQPHGLVHGGVYPLVAESITSAVSGSFLAEREMIAMGQSNAATFLRPITAGTVHATARRRHAGRTTWLWDVEFTDDDEHLCAMVRMTLAVRPRPEA